jgi:hypothetical protein
MKNTYLLIKTDGSIERLPNQSKDIDSTDQWPRPYLFNEDFGDLPTTAGPGVLMWVAIGDSDDPDRSRINHTASAMCAMADSRICGPVILEIKNR